MADPEKGSNVKFVVITVAVVVLILGGLFFWFMGKDTWISGASTYSGTGTLAAGTPTVGANTENMAVAGAGSSSINEENSVNIVPGMSTKIAVDTVPVIKRETQAEDMQIKFSNLNTNIKVNKESLQLDSLNNVDLQIHGFVGNILLNEKTVSLTGKVSRLQVNGVVLSSEGMQISFDGLDYEYFGASGIMLEQINLAGTQGQFGLLEGKVVYALENKDKVTFNQVFGNFAADKAAKNRFTGDLTVQGVATAGSVNAAFN
jgi:hypothetical protein